MRHVSIRIAAYDVSIILIVAIGVMLGSVIAATYMWATKTVTVSVEEPLTITGYPSTIHTHPGQNETLDIVVENAASVTYTVTLIFALNDTAYQTQYVGFSNFNNNTYTINPGTNQVTAWMVTSKEAQPVNLQLTIQFIRK